MTNTTSIMPKIVGMKEFRMNIAKLTREAQKKRQPITVMSRTKPLFTVQPFAEGAQMSDLLQRIKEADADVAAGRVISHDEMLAVLEAR